MDGLHVEQIRNGMEVRDIHGTPVGTVVAVHPEPPEGTMANAVGYLEVDEQRPDREKHLHIPMTEVLEVRSDGVIVELDPDFVVAHTMQWFPKNLLKQQ
jgi:hypothetical protein